jgi:hypothetical protein
MRMAVGALWGCVAFCVTTQTSRADDVHLEGDRVIEGKAVRHDDKVTIELESGSITLSAGEVRSIEPRESNVQRYDRLYAGLKPGDIEERVALADFCRDHAMHQREQHMLEEVLERAPNHTAARTRLGYVKSTDGWITREQDYRARGLVRFEGAWMTPEARDAAQRAQAAADTARRQRALAVELEDAKLALEKQRLALEAQRLQAEQQNAARQADAPSIAYYGYGAGYYYTPARVWAGPSPRATCGYGRPCGPVSSPYGAFPIAGVRDPRDRSFNLPGFRDPNRYVRGR